MNAVLAVDLDAFAANLARVRAVVAPAEVMLVVKDDAYGHGLAPVVRRAAAEGVRWIGAFDVPTGRAVRAVLGADIRIFVWMSPSATHTAAAVADRLDIGVGDAELLEEVAEASRREGAVARIHLKIDTGLHRNGVRPQSWEQFVARAAQLTAEGAVEVVGVWTHISEASDADDDAARAVFEAALATVRRAGLTPDHRHLAASAASFARAEFRYDMVRVGAFAYGIRSAGGPSERDLGLRLAATLTARVTHVGAERVAVGIGALEGLPSTLGGRVVVNTGAGRRELCFDGDDAFVTGWPDASVGDTVVVFGGAENDESPTDLAEAIGSVGEEMLVRLSPLVARRYEGEAV